MSRNLLAFLDHRPVRFLTLTLKSSHDPLSQQIDRLYLCFNKLRRTRIWRTKTNGGVAFLEITWNETRQSWHPHLHLITEGHFIPQNLLSKTWLATTGDSFIVDIRAVRDHAEIVRYVLKYVAKPLPAPILRHTNRCCEAIVALNGRRAALTFGSWRGLKLTEKTDSTVWLPLAPLTYYRTAATAGDPDAIRILSLLQRNTASCCEITSTPYRPP